MNVIGCLDTPSQGEYWLNDKEVSKMSDVDLSKVRNDEIGFVFQTFNLLTRLTALENVALPLVYAGIPLKERNERAAETLNKVGLGDRFHHKPNELSGGQRQRVAVARALINNPSLLLADEPTGNLDSATGGVVEDTLFALNKENGITLVIVTHDEDLAAKCERQVYLNYGEIVSSLSTPSVKA
jgi:putative ABC transport system ATP-binding protein